MKRLFTKHFIINTLLALVVVFVGTAIFNTKIQQKSVITSFKNDAIYNGSENSGGVSLMFNVYGGTSEVEKILEILDKTSSKATFFLGGCWADDNLDLVKKILSLGHEIGSHGYFHKDHAKLSYEQNLEEIKHTHQLISVATGVEMSLFAPPSGSFSINTVKACKSLGYHVIMWTQDTIDWRDQDVNLIKNRAVKNLKAGNFILMHPTKATALALEDIILTIKDANLKMITVSENLQGL